MTESPMKKYGARLVDNGYKIIPIMPGTKKPGRWTGTAWVDFTGWRQFASTPPTQYHVELWEKWPDCGVGVLCGDLCPADIDILDHGVANAVAERITDHLGETPLVRIGKAPKMLLVYRTETPFKKIQMHPIECLADGQQFVAYATHPDTGLPYEWPIETLVDTPIDRIPVVTEAQMRKAMEAAYAVIPDHLKPARLYVVADNTEPHVAGDLEGTPEAIEAILDLLPNDDAKDWNFWNRVGMATFKASRGRCFDAFDKWSRRNKSYDPHETQKTWRGYKLGQITSIGFGTLQWLLDQSGAGTIDPEIPFNEAKRTAVDFDLSAILEADLPPKPEPKPNAKPADQVVLSKQQRDAFPHEWLTTPSLIGQITQWIVSCALYPHPPLALANTLALMGAVCGRRYRLSGQKTDSDTRANVFLVGIAETASGKEHSRRCISRLLNAAGLTKIVGGMRFTSDTAITNMIQEHPSRLCAVDELGVYMQAMRHKNSSGPMQTVMLGFLDFFSASGGVYNGKQYADTKARPRADIVFPNFNMYATTTPESLVPALSRDLVENGLLNRMLFFPPFEVYPYSEETQARLVVPPDLIDRLKGVYRAAPPGSGNLVAEQISTLEPELIEVVFAAGVEDHLKPIRDRQTDLMRAGRKIWGRSAEYTSKLAMLEAIARNPLEPMITEDILVMAYHLVEWSTLFMEGLINQDVAENETEARVKKVLKIITKTGDRGILSSDLYDQTLSIQKRERDDIIRGLIDSGRVSEERVKTKGRPKFLYKAAS